MKMETKTEDLEAHAKTLVEFMDEWQLYEWRTKSNTPKGFEKKDGVKRAIQNLWTDRNLWNRVEEEIKENHMHHSYVTELGNEGAFSADREQEWFNFRHADLEDCLKAAAKLEPIKSEIEAIQEEKNGN